MFTCLRRLVLPGRRGFHSCFRSFSSIIERDPPSLSNMDCRPLALQARVDFLIRLGDLDTAAKHARLAALLAKSSHEYNFGFCINATCQAIIGAMCEAKRYQDALDLFKYFYRDSKITGGFGYFNHIVKLHLNHGRLNEALNLYDSSMADSDSVTRTLISKGLVDAGRLEEAMDRFKPKGLKLRDLNSHLCNPLFQGLLQQGDVEKANEVLGFLLGQSHYYGRLYDEVATLSSTYMKYWFEKGKEEIAMECYSRLQLSKLTESNVVNTLLALLLKYGKRNEAWSLFDEVLYSEEEYNIDECTVNIMVNECFEMGRFDRAIQTFYKVKASLSEVGVTCYRNIIVRLKKKGILFEAEHLFEDMCSDRLVRPDASTYATMIDAYLEAGRTEDALRISNRMVDAFLGQVASLACL